MMSFIVNSRNVNCLSKWSIWTQLFRFGHLKKTWCIGRTFGPSPKFAFGPLFQIKWSHQGPYQPKSIYIPGQQIKNEQDQMEDYPLFFICQSSHINIFKSFIYLYMINENIIKVILHLWHVFLVLLLIDRQQQIL